MGAWENMTVNNAVVAGLAENLLTDRQTGSIDVSRVTQERSDAARGKLEDVLFSDGGLAEYIEDAGGVDALLDALAGDATLTGRLDRGHALAFLAIYAPDSAITSGGLRQQRGNSVEDELTQWARSFGSIAPYVLGYTTSTTATQGGGAFASTMGTYDHD